MSERRHGLADALVSLGLRRSGRRLSKRADDDPAREVDLERVMRQTDRGGQHQLRRSLEHLRGDLPTSAARPRDAPGLVRDPAKGKARRDDDPSITTRAAAADTSAKAKDSRSRILR